MLRIVSNASSVQELVQTYSRLCDQDSIYVVTRDAPGTGPKTRFVLTLADGNPALSGTGHIAEVYHDKENPFGHPGMKLCFDQIDPHCKPVLERLATSGSASISGLALIGELNAGSIESILQCAVSEEPDLPAARPLTPAPPIQPHHAVHEPSPAQPHGGEPATQQMPGLPEAMRAKAAAMPTERVPTLPPAAMMPPPLPHNDQPSGPQVIASPDLPAAAPGEMSTRATTPFPIAPATPAPGMLRPTTPFPSSPAPPPAAVPVYAAPAPFAVDTRRAPGHIEPTQIVRPLKRPINRTAIILSAVAVVLIGLAGSYLLWGRTNSSSASASSTAAEDDDATDQPDADKPGADTAAAGPGDCKLSIVTTPEGATVRAQERELGATPLDTTLPCGPTVLQIERSRYLTVNHELELAPDRDNKVELALDRPTTKLEVVSSPDGATVLIDGKKVGQTPVTVEVEAYSRTSIVVRKSRHHSFRKRVYPKPPRYKVEAKLKKRR